ncbi:MAG: M20/M25/M40 family metallo-hydrolase [Ardenticatenales bacterium]|nr:M20/M25/M40 family metallo-hydrolase [Ardenticatenales bacterium]
MLEESLSFLRTLLTTPSPTGFEMAGQRVWRDYVAQFADTVESDAYGNVYATLHADSETTVMLTGHADEIGFMVNYITDEGFIYYKPIGGVDPSMVRGRRVIIHNERGSVRGVTAAPPIHLQDRDNEPKPPKHHENFIDIGVTSREAAEELVQIGDAITYVDDFEILREDVAIARAMDNRVGTFAAAEALRRCAENRHRLQTTVVAVSTVMEEVGGHGAAMATYRLSPTVAVVMDVTHATDWPTLSKERHGGIKMGKGPVLAHGAGVHPVVRRRLEKVARENAIPIQFQAAPNYTSTDLDAVFLSRAGVPTALISLPNRYMHTTVEMIRLGDLELVAKLMGEFALSVTDGERFRVEI